jgi:hypothetical protein
MAHDTGKATRPKGKQPRGGKPADPAAAVATAAPRPNSVLGTALRVVSGDERRLMICQAAYFLAEQRGFEAGHEMEDWLAAESQVDAALARGELPGARAR